MAIPGILKRFPTDLTLKPKRTATVSDKPAHRAEASNDTTITNDVQGQNKGQNKDQNHRKAPDIIKLFNRTTFPLGPDSKPHEQMNGQNEHNVAAQRTIEAAIRVQKKRAFLEIIPPKHNSSDMAPANTSLPSALSSPANAKRDRTASARVQRLSRFLTSIAPPDIPQDQHEALEHFTKHRRDSKTSTTTSEPKLPSLESDILWLSLTFVAKPPFQTVCHICYQDFKSWKAKECASWRLHGCGHYVHFACLERMRNPLAGDGNEAVQMRCKMCDSLKRRLGKIEEGDFERRVERLEGKLCPWKVDSLERVVGDEVAQGIVAAMRVQKVRVEVDRSLDAESGND